ncbi:MAG: kinase/pyrophosphorylase [Rhodospirillales bacterium]|nr:kinase/pyrophosphorylase [Rhodospirillales bacterium]
MKSFHLHLVSDATGETVSSVARACLVQFEDIAPIQHQWWLVRSEVQIERVLKAIEDEPGLVLYTVIDAEVRARLDAGCRRLNVPCIGVLHPVISALAKHLDAEMASPSPGRQHAMDADYFARIDAMHFTLAHDDGQMVHDLDSADIIVLGVSRTSKTPTCMYLANRGIKAANVPLVPGVPVPPEVMAAKNPLIVGLTREPSSLSDIRRNRLRLLDQSEDGSYADVEKVREEILGARRLFAANGWPVIDVTRRSIEEAAANILQLYAKKTGKVL